jgi:CheY-like chemotaxis protein
MMPVMNGWTFLERFRVEPRYQDIPVVIITAKDLTLEERGRLEAQTVGIVPMREGFEDRLQEVLTEIFPDLT